MREVKQFNNKDLNSVSFVSNLLNINNTKFILSIEVY